MKKLFAVLVAGAFATSAFAVDASAPATHSAEAKAPASGAKRVKHHKKVHHKVSTKKAASAA